MNEPRDQAVRDAAAHELGTSFFLEAGAGTGKTTILVERVLEIVRTGSALVNEVVVITFTEKAAGELRARVRAELHKQANASAGEERERFLHALRTLDAAHIETIHAFTSSILRERPLEAGVDPAFQQLDEVGNELDFEERWRDWIWSVGGEELGAVERCLLLELPLDEIRKVARWLMENRDVEVTAVAPSAPDPLTTLQRLLALRDAARDAAKECRDERDYCHQCYSRAAAKLEELAGVPPSAVLPELNRLEIKAWGGNLKNWPSAAVRQRVRDALDQMSDALTEFQTATRNSALAHLVNALAGFVQDAALARIADGKLNFEDLLIEARRLIVGHDEVRRYLQRRYKFLLVDEFQDTDPIQAEIVFLLAAREDGMDPAPAWTDVTLEPGKLFVVGDPKQSIYRFRRADIAAFMKAREVFERHAGQGESARVESISQNFRSVPEVVGWVNEVFGGVIARLPDLPFAQPEYEPIEAFRQEAGEPRVLHLYPADDLSDLKIDQARAREADAIARLIGCMAGGLQDGAGRTAGLPSFADVRFKDICVLIETRTKIELYTAALEARGIPYVLDGGKEFFQRQEVKDIAAILRVMDDPSDSVSLAAALKSEAFACSDVELLQYKLNGGRFHIFNDTIEPDPVSEALGRLRDLYNHKAGESMPAFVDRVVRESFLVESKLLEPNGRQRGANLRLIVQRAVDFAANDVDSLRPFIRWISERQREGGQETESQVHESDDNVVRISTVHGAKGLEFPVVILAKLAGGQASSRAFHIVDRASSTLELQVGSQYRRFSTPGFEVAWQTEGRYEDAEERRLLYVAATRAKDFLIVPVYKPQESEGQHVYLRAIPSWDRARGNPASATFAGAGVIIDDAIPEPVRLAPAPMEVPPNLVGEWQERMRTIRERAAAGPRFEVPSRLGEDETKEPRESEPKDRSEDPTDPDVQTDTEQALGFAEGAAGNLFAGSSGARKRGSLVHEVLYRCDLADPASAATWSLRLCAQRGTPELATEVEEHAKRILESEAMARVRRAKSVLRELPVAWFDKSKDMYLEGFVDLAFEEDGGWVIVDYKTDRVDGKTATLLSRYGPQVHGYRQALEAAGMSVKETGLWFTQTGEHVSIE